MKCSNANLPFIALHDTLHNVTQFLTKLFLAEHITQYSLLSPDIKHGFVEVKVDIGCMLRWLFRNYLQAGFTGPIMSTIKLYVPSKQHAWNLFGRRRGGVALVEFKISHFSCCIVFLW